VFGYKAAYETPNLPCCAGIQFITKSYKLIPLLVVDPNDKLTVFGFAFFLAAHGIPQADNAG